jgi:predicted Fe-Mo cluster-binding NifX family protein
MKIAVVSDDEQTISQHFGRAEKYIIISCEQERIIERKSLPKPDFCHSSHRRHRGHEHQADPRGNGFGRRPASSHKQLFETVRDCDILVSRGMGHGAYLDLQQLGIKPIITDIENIDMAIQAAMDDSIINHLEKLH